MLAFWVKYAFLILDTKVEICLNYQKHALKCSKNNIQINHL